MRQRRMSYDCFSETYPAISFNHSFPMAWVYFVPAVCAQVDPTIKIKTKVIEIIYLIVTKM